MKRARGDDRAKDFDRQRDELRATRMGLRRPR